MQIKPVITKKHPEYPTEYLFINNPELFKQYIPLRWYKNKVVCTALTAFILAGGTESLSQPQQPTTEIKGQNGTNKPLKENKNDSVKVAPIFVHGDGSGAVGCMIISPPVFITESEAMEIIKTELQKENITIDATQQPIIHFQADALADRVFEDEEPRKTLVVLDIDGVDKKNNFMIEYISTQDFMKFHAERLPSNGIDYWSSSQGYHTKQAAEVVREELITKCNFNAVVFYDPIYNANTDEEMSNAQKLAKSKEQLVAQVQDFINWLKAEEIIK